MVHHLRTVCPYFLYVRGLLTPMLPTKPWVCLLSWGVGIDQLR
jgi:hypothetical protein